MAIDPREESDGRVPPQPKPPEAPTTKLDKDEITRQLLDKVLLKLNEVGHSQTDVTASVAILSGDVRAIGSKVDIVAVDVHAVKAEQVEFREWKGAVEERFKTHSMGAKNLSVHDTSQDAKLQELENRLAKQAESSMRAILAEVTEAAKVVVKTPLGQRVAKAAGYALVAFFGFATLYFGAMTARLQQPTQSNVVQVSPVTVYADAGVDQ